MHGRLDKNGTGAGCAFLFRMFEFGPWCQKASTVPLVSLLLYSFTSSPSNKLYVYLLMWVYLYKRQTNNQTWAESLGVGSGCVGGPSGNSSCRISLINLSLFSFWVLVGGFFLWGALKSCTDASFALTHITRSSSVLFLAEFLYMFFFFYRGCCVPGMGFSAGCPPGPRPWMSTRGTRGLCRLGCGAEGVRYMLLYMAAAAAAAVVLSTVPSRLGW